MDDNCRELILSEETTEFNVLSFFMTPELMEYLHGVCYQQNNGRYFTIYSPVKELSEAFINRISYGMLPKLYGEMSTTALDISGVTQLANQPVLNLKGQGVLIGVVDSGIDYTHPAFIDEYGKTRILRIWDQTTNTGTPPEGINYGTEYTEDDINEALKAENPLDIVNTTDSTGHGTFLTGVTAGSADPANDFTGAVPEAKIIVVKLKPAKKFLRNFYFINDNVPAYQENDIMLGLNYIRRCSVEFGLPISIPFGLGTNLGGHDGFSSLSYTMNSISSLPGFCICVPTGNEGNTRQHYHGIISNVSQPDLVELSVTDKVSGIILEIWGQNPAVLSVSIESPTGEALPRIPARLQTTQTYNFIFDKTTVVVDYELVDSSTADEVIILKLKTPTQGIWKINVYSNIDNSVFDVYLPGVNFIGNNAYFLKPDPNITLTGPSSASNVITISGYDAVTGAFYQDSGRGFTRIGAYKPDICAPCTSITGPNLRGGYEQRSGTSLAAAITAGACAQFLTWAVTNRNSPLITSINIKSSLIRGAIRKLGETYPSRQWGYGTLDVYNSFDVLRKGGEI